MSLKPPSLAAGAPLSQTVRLAAGLLQSGIGCLGNTLGQGLSQLVRVGAGAAASAGASAAADLTAVGTGLLQELGTCGGNTLSTGEAQALATCLACLRQSDTPTPAIQDNICFTLLLASAATCETDAIRP